MSQDIKNINIADLKMDLQNPRLPKSKQGKDEKTVIEFMLLEAATLELMLAIGENDFFAGELLLVIPDEKEKNKYIVIEGNRRLTAVKLLNNLELATVKKIATKEIVDNAKFKPVILPCLQFNSREEISKYLGFIHITGKKSWRLLEKARYLYELRSKKFTDFTFLKSTNEIAKIIGSSAAYVKRLLISFELYKIVEDEAFYKISGLNDTDFFLNYFTDSLNKDNICKYIGVDLSSDNPIENLKKENLEKLVHWWFEKTEGGQSRVLGDSKGLKMLNAILGKKIAQEAFENGATISEAYDLTDDIDLQFAKKIQKSLEFIEQADNLSNKVKIFYKELYEDLKMIKKITLKINDFRSNLERGDYEF